MAHFHNEKGLIAGMIFLRRVFFFFKSLIILP